MERSKFEKAMTNLAANCVVMPEDEQLQARLPVIWENVCTMQHDRLERGIRFLITRHDFRFFPTVGELLGAIEEAAALDYRWEGNIDAEQRRRVDDPAYRKKLREESERAAKAYFESPEHKRLLGTMAKVPANPQYPFLEGVAAVALAERKRRRKAKTK